METTNTWAAFDVKLTGNERVVDEAAQRLIDFAAEIDVQRHGAPCVLVVVTGTGGALGPK